MKKIFVFILILFCISNVVFASDWIYLGMDSSKIKIYADIDSISSRENPYAIVTMWTKEYSEDGSYELICQSFKNNYKEQALVSFVKYDSKGNVIENYNCPILKFTPVVPDSMGEGIALFAKVFLQKPKIFAINWAKNYEINIKNREDHS